MDNYTGTTSLHIEADSAATVNFDNIEFVGSSGSAPNYANPHAPTTINGVSQTYDNNGNLTSTGAGLANTWNYQNRLIQSHGGGTASTTYLYDHTGQRTAKTSNSITTHYPSALYEAQGATTTKHVYVGDQVVATIQSDTPGPKTFHNHLDHLGSTQVVSTPDGHLNQEMAYYPFGSPRITNQYGELNQKNRYIGQDYDEESSLSYLNARYYDSSRGQFTSQDPVFWSTNQNLRNPQSMNSYSYSENNPVNRKDPSGLASKKSEAALRAEIARLQNKLLNEIKRQLQQIADDLIRGGRNGTVNPINGVKATADSNRSAPERVGSAAGSVYGGVLYTAGTIGYAYGMSRAPIPTIGATVAVAERYSNDRRNGTRSTPQQYLGSVLFGGGAAVATQGQSIPQSILRITVISGTENVVLDSSTQPTDVVGDVFGGVAARLTGRAVSTPQVAPTTQAIIEGATEFSAYSAFVRFAEWATN